MDPSCGIIPKNSYQARSPIDFLLCVLLKVFGFQSKSVIQVNSYTGCEAKVKTLFKKILLTDIKLFKFT